MDVAKEAPSLPLRTAVDVLTWASVASEEEFRSFLECFNDHWPEWCVAYAAFNARHEALGLDIDDLYERNFQIGAMIDDLLASRGIHRIPLPAVQIIVACACGMMYPEVSRGIGRNMHKTLVELPLQVLEKIQQR